MCMWCLLYMLRTCLTFLFYTPRSAGELVNFVLFCWSQLAKQGQFVEDLSLLHGCNELDEFRWGLKLPQAPEMNWNEHLCSGNWRLRSIPYYPVLYLIHLYTFVIWGRPKWYCWSSFQSRLWETANTVKWSVLPGKDLPTLIQFKKKQNADCDLENPQNQQHGNLKRGANRCCNSKGMQRC